jgi:hypothetical protein
MKETYGKNPFRLPGTKKGNITTLYPVAVTRNRSRYLAECVALPDCSIEAHGLEASMFLIKDAITKRLMDMSERGALIGTPQLPDYYQEDRPELRDPEIMWMMVPVDWSVIHSAAKNISITIPGHLLARFDQYAEQAGISRSGFLVQVAAMFLDGRGKI